jgi:hypothetical protein
MAANLKVPCRLGCCACSAVRLSVIFFLAVSLLPIRPANVLPDWLFPISETNSSPVAYLSPFNKNL